ncbi:uncharacterized protein LOC135326747 [Dromaius novaehollandiae]|uniref:uncharacterized protein LOC135326747 n=1 Tax=Dromaius novaehollandiae TaxID=8790 RepID=UPI00311E158A
MAGCSALVCLLLCTLLVHGVPIPGEREASVLSEVLSPKGSAEADPSPPKRRTVVVIVANTLTLVILTLFFAFCVWLYYRLKTRKERSPEDDAEASACHYRCHCGELHSSLQCTCSRCASPSAASLELCNIWGNEDDNPYGGLLPSLPPTPGMGEFSRSSSSDSATTQEENTAGAGAPGTGRLEAPTGDKA